jgi:hypothetical protein
MSNDARQRPFELAKSKTPPLDLPILFNWKPLPSFKFCSILFFGSAGNFLASPPGNFPLQPLRISEIIIEKPIIMTFLFEFILIKVKTYTANLDF